MARKVIKPRYVYKVQPAITSNTKEVCWNSYAVYRCIIATTAQPDQRTLLKKRFHLKDCSECLSFHLTRTVQAQMLRSDPASMASLSSIKMAGQFFYLGKSRNMCDCCVTVFFFFSKRAYFVW